MFDDFGGFNDFNNGLDDFGCMNDLYYQQDAMQQDLFSATDRAIPTTTVRQHATATGRIPAAGNDGTKSVSLFRKIIDFIFF